MQSLASSNRNIFTVTKLNRFARSVLESEIGQIWLSAEVSNFVSASSGHWYFTLKDDRAQVKAAMFRGANMRVATRVKEGDKVLVRANVGIYEARGDYQLVVDYLEPDGEGILKQQFELLKQKLLVEGLFDQAHKKSLPDTIKTVGVITSATGAALHDILTVMKRRNPTINIIVYPTQVQGEAAPQQICQAISKAQSRQEVDVLIVGRGGGSLEDLWCFNDENVARALYLCPIPVISAVGHEVDVTIADFVADLRAPTPSAAAELVSSDLLVHLNNIQRLQLRLKQVVTQHLKTAQQQYTGLNHRLSLSHPQTRILQQYQRLDRLELALNAGIKRRIEKSVNQLQSTQNRLLRVTPTKQIDRNKLSVNEHVKRLQNSMFNLMKNKSFRLAKAGQLLETVSPLSTLSRGYSITFKDQQIVKKVSELNSGDEITTRFSDGQISSVVK